MSVPLEDRDGAMQASAADDVLAAAERADVVVLGPGMGRAPETFSLAMRLIEELAQPVVLDADGLNALAHAGLERAATRTAPTILTPHAGELGRLLDRPSAEISAHRLQAAQEAAQRSGAVVLLKGDDTLVADSGRPVAVSRGGAGALATAGTGDVLSGVIAAFLARGMEPFAAACAAVEAHRQAGRAAGAQRGPASVIATDVIAELAGALRATSTLTPVPLRDALRRDSSRP